MNRSKIIISMTLFLIAIIFVALMNDGSHEFEKQTKGEIVNSGETIGLFPELDMPPWMRPKDLDFGRGGPSWYNRMVKILKDTEISFPVGNYPICVVLDSLEKKLKVTIVYDSSEIDPETPVQIGTSTASSVWDLLMYISGRITPGYGWRIMNGKLVMVTADKPFGVDLLPFSGPKTKSDSVVGSLKNRKFSSKGAKGERTGKLSVDWRMVSFEESACNISEMTGIKTIVEPGIKTLFGKALSDSRINLKMKGDPVSVMSAVLRLIDPEAADKTEVLLRKNVIILSPLKSGQN